MPLCFVSFSKMHITNLCKHLCYSYNHHTHLNPPSKMNHPNIHSKTLIHYETKKKQKNNSHPRSGSNQCTIHPHLPNQPRQNNQTLLPLRNGHIRPQRRPRQFLRIHFQKPRPLRTIQQRPPTIPSRTSQLLPWGIGHRTPKRTVPGEYHAWRV